MRSKPMPPRCLTVMAEVRLRRVRPGPADPCAATVVATASPTASPIASPTATAPRTGRRVLFLTHAASRNGASLLLLHLLQWLHAHTDLQLAVLSNGDGPLIDAFRQVASTRVWRNPLCFLRAVNRPWAHALRAGAGSLLLRAYVKHQRVDLVYANTAAVGSGVLALLPTQTKVLWHIHELAYALKLSWGHDQVGATLATTLSSATRVIAVSQPVVDTLTREFAVPSERIDLIHGFVPMHSISAAQHSTTRLRICAELGWPADAFVVAGCGGLGWRKGSDLFLQMACAVQRLDGRSAVRFLWVGGGQHDGVDALQFAHDVRSLGLAQVCCRVAATPAVDDYYSAMDVFALTSREDPFPLVMLEAAVHGVPTVCFDAAGGGPEFVSPHAGVVVPYLNLDAFARAVVELHRAPAQRLALGLAAQRKVRLQHTVDTQGPMVLRSIERCLAATAAAVGHSPH